MKKSIMGLALLSLSLHAEHKPGHKKSEAPHELQEKTRFINDNEKSAVTVKIYDRKGKQLINKNLSAKGSYVGFESFDFTPDKEGQTYIVEVVETTGENPLKSAPYSVHTRNQDKQGTVKVKRVKWASGDELILVGNKESDKEGTFVRKTSQPSWLQDDATKKATKARKEAKKKAGKTQERVRAVRSEKKPKKQSVEKPD